jgi:ABC-type uncharacterized transport system ATPase subunit
MDIMNGKSSPLMKQMKTLRWSIGNICKITHNLEEIKRVMDEMTFKIRKTNLNNT